MEKNHKHFISRMFSKDPELYVKQLFDIGKGQHVPITGLGMEYKGVECFFFKMWQNYLHELIPIAKIYKLALRVHNEHVALNLNRLSIEMMFLVKFVQFVVYFSFYIISGANNNSENFLCANLEYHNVPNTTKYYVIATTPSRMYQFQVRS